MWTFTGMKFGVALEIVQSTKPHLACLADIWLLLAMRQEMAFEIMMAREFSLAIRTPMLLL
jgi:hypothetical protein